MPSSSLASVAASAELMLTGPAPAMAGSSATISACSSNRERTLLAYPCDMVLPPWHVCRNPVGAVTGARLTQRPPRTSREAGAFVQYLAQDSGERGRAARGRNSSAAIARSVSQDWQPGQCQRKLELSSPQTLQR